MADMYVVHMYKLTSLDRGLLEVKQKTRSYLKITISTHHQATSFFLVHTDARYRRTSPYTIVIDCIRIDPHESNGTKVK